MIVFSRKNRGYSLLEALIAGALLVAALGFVLTFSTRNQEAFKTSTYALTAQSKAKMVIDQIADELRLSGFLAEEKIPADLLDVDPGMLNTIQMTDADADGAFDRLDFFIPSLDESGYRPDVVWNPIRYSYFSEPQAGEIPGNNIDDDHNGFIDDYVVRRLVYNLATDEVVSERTLGRAVRNEGFTVTSDGRCITVALDILQYDKASGVRTTWGPEDLVSVSCTTTVYPRNTQ